RPGTGRVAGHLGIRPAERVTLNLALDGCLGLDRKAAFCREAAVALDGPCGFAANRQILASERAARDGDLDVVFRLATDRRSRGRIALGGHFRLPDIDAVIAGSP